MAKDILVVIEHEDGKLRRASLEAIAAARKIAEGLGSRVVGIALGESAEALATEAADRGADEVFFCESPQFARYNPDSYRQSVRSLIEELEPDWVLMGHTYNAQDLLPIVSATFGAPILSDSVALEMDGETVVFHRQPYDAKFVARTVDRGPAPHFATLQAGAFSADDLPTGHGGTTSRREPEIDEAAIRRQVLEIRAVGESGIDLTAAEVVVAGGRGLGSKESFESLVSALAKQLGGAVGASRPVVDAEWLPHDHQIGSSGQAITPKLYVALGISGAIQHVVGIRGTQCIVAINRDKDAPIFNEAQYGIVGEIGEVVPELIKAIEEANAE